MESGFKEYQKFMENSDFNSNDNMNDFNSMFGMNPNLNNENDINKNLDDMIPQFMNCFSQLEKDPQFSNMMQGMMSQFMSKDVILEPMKIL